MAVTFEQVRAALEPEEPDYASAAQLGADAIPYLTQLVQGDDPMLASKAAYLASLIESADADAVVAMAANSAHEAVRAAAAASVRNLSQMQVSLVESLLHDQDASIRKVTLHSIQVLPPAAVLQASPLSRSAGQPPLDVKSIVEEVAQSDPEPLLRQLASQIAAQLP